MTNGRDSSQIKFLAIDKLEYDLNNPRLPKSLGKDKKDILDWMISKENITDLMSSIAEKGFFPGEPILVIPGESNQYTVIEGNRRYTATLLLSHPELAPQKKGTITDIVTNANHIPNELPALIFEKREDIIDYLGYRHITGVEPWDALAKARYLRQLSKSISGSDFGEKCKSLARQIGSKAPYVKQLLLGIELYETIETNDFFGIKGLDDRTFEFGTFYTGIVRPNISKYLGLDFEAERPAQNIDITNLNEFTTWLFKENDEGKTRLGESRNLTKLDKILDPQYPQALEAFKEGTSLEFASELTDEPDQIVKENLKKCEEIVMLTWKYFPQVKDYSSLKKEDLRKISQYIKQMHEMLISKQEANEDPFL